MNIKTTIIMTGVLYYIINKRNGNYERNLKLDSEKASTKIIIESDRFKQVLKSLSEVL